MLPLLPGRYSRLWVLGSATCRRGRRPLLQIPPAQFLVRFKLPPVFIDGYLEHLGQVSVVSRDDCRGQAEKVGIDHAAAADDRVVKFDADPVARWLNGWFVLR